MSNEEKSLVPIIKQFKEGEYEHQFFGISSVSFFAKFESVILSAILQGMEKLEKTLLQNCKTDDEQKSVKVLICNLQNKYMQNAEIYLKEAQSQIYSLFRIPPGVILPEDEAQKRQYSDDDNKEIDNEINNLKSRYRRAVCMETILKNEKKMISLNVNIMEKKLLELNDSITTISQIFERKKESMEILSNIANDMKYITETINKLSINFTPDNNAYIRKKLELFQVE